MQAFTVRDVIDVCANLKGGIHFDDPVSQAEQSLIKLDRTYLPFFVDASLAALPGIAWTVVVGARPLIETVLRKHHVEVPCRRSAALALMPVSRILSLAPYLFWLALTAITVLSLIPSNVVPGPLQFWDKAQHALAFCLLTILGGPSYPRHLKMVVVSLLVYGGLIEVAQSTLTTTRFGDAIDWVADAIGVAAGTVLHATLLYKLTPQTASPPDRQH